MLQFIVLIISFSVVYSSYWTVSSNGFFPEQEVDTRNVLPKLKNILLTDHSTKSITETLDNESGDYSNEPESSIENAYDILTVAMCRIGYNQNPTGGKSDPIIIPSGLTSKLITFASILNREPSTSYSTLVLNNCIYVGNNTIPSKSDWIIKHTVTQPSEEAHEVEKGFYASHCAVEREFSNSVININQLKNMFLNNDKIDPSVLTNLAYNVRKATSVLKHMRHFFEPDLFFTKLRPYLKCGNIGDNGVIFEMYQRDNICTKQNATIILPSKRIRFIEFNKPIYGFRGPTVAMTSSLSAIDSVLQITTSISADKDLESTMNDFKEYQPIAHVQYINEISNMKLRDFVELSGNKNLIDAYNDAVTSVAEFRFGHIDHVMTYILKSIPQVPPKYVTGTGNTPIVSYLCKSAMGTLKSRIINGITSNNLPSVSIPVICQKECHADKLEIFDSDYCSNIGKY